MKVTSRERPYKLRDAVIKYTSLAHNTKDMVWLFTFDHDDYQINRAHYEEITKPLNAIVDIQSSRTTKIGAINSGVNQLTDHWDILLNISDDQIPIVKGYDDRIRKAMPPNLDASIWFNDGWQNRINTQEILGREYYSRFGHVYDPRFKSFFCDNYSTDIGMRLDKLLKFKDCIIKHFHPGHDPSLKGKHDNLYKLNDSFWNEDKEMYQKLKG